ncbi:MarR family winged helix-turn-helix transcriptional regulator [Actinomadura luteofluorescens]|uniref:DNA-binding MarR family transcriptional regulator n=1 Tax=Actinomadura luteofluorescens TaxID=46163 RepID=A0A7Y9EGV7_9ACTN|nr:MarR family winged helix-turn-helix transcriptional regulator [Actinomadura luteofluorescens]NYD47479.1 DNA-binding MarR family transcriptional regulator [Actinomadura luteofluorescens]
MLDDLLERVLSEDGDPADRHVGLGMLLAAAHNRSRAGMNDELRPLGVDVRGFGMLLALEMYGPSSQRRLIDLTGIDKSTMVRIVDELEAGGLVRRERAPRDRRAHSISLTPDGTRALEGGRRAGAAVGERIFGRLDRDERDRLVELLRRIAEDEG